MLELQILNWVIQNKDFYILPNNGIDESFFIDYKDTYCFIRDFVKNEGYTPSLETVISQSKDNFSYVNVTESIDYLIRALKSQVAKAEVAELLQKEAPKFYDEMHGIEFIKWLQYKLDKLVDRYDINSKGVDFKTNAELRLQAYYQRANNTSRKIWHTDLQNLNDLVGGFISGTYITVIAETGQGKSWISRRILPIPAWINGANVLDYCLEMTNDQIQPRLDCMLGAILNEKNGLNTRFSCRGLMFGNLPPDELFAYKNYLEHFNDYFPRAGKYVIKTMDDVKELTLDRLEADIEENNADIVLIDPFYYMGFLRNIDNKTGGAAERTSRELRKLFNRMQVIGIVVSQATVQKKGKDIEVQAPTLEQTKTTKALIEDAGLVFSFAAKRNYNLGKLSVLKNRDGNSGDIELVVDFDYGIIREHTGEELF